MRDGLNILAAQSSLGLCLEARALFVTVAWTHKSPLLADAAARSKSSFLKVELDFCAVRFPKLSRRERLLVALAHTHAAGSVDQPTIYYHFSPSSLRRASDPDSRPLDEEGVSGEGGGVFVCGQLSQ